MSAGEGLSLTGLPVSTAGIAWCRAARLTAVRVCCEACRGFLAAPGMTTLPSCSAMASAQPSLRSRRDRWKYLPSRNQRTSSQAIQRVWRRVRSAISLSSKRSCVPLRPGTIQVVSGRASTSCATALTEEEYEPVMLFLNHSCEPNVGFAGNIILVAMRDIGPGEELTTDYALFDDHDGTMKCRCGTPSCRGTITGGDWRRPDLQRKYGHYFSAYLQRRQSGQWP